MTTAVDHAAGLEDKTIIRTETLWSADKDKYGRPVKTLYRLHFNAAGYCIKHDRDVAVVVTMPKAYRAMCPGENYMVNIRPTGAVYSTGTITHHATLNGAKFHAATHS
jgi:hypothetical protein